MNFCWPYPRHKPIECLNWVCECKESNGNHGNYTNRCTKKEMFKFLHNNNCTIECQFYFKLLQSKGEQK